MYASRITASKRPRHVLAAVAAALLILPLLGHAEDFAPYGTASSELRPYPELDLVFDVNYEDPTQLHVLYDFVRNSLRHVTGRKVVVTHGPELRVFAKESYEDYQGIVDRMAELAREGVEFRMCNDAMRASGFTAEDMHGFITVISSGFPEIALLQSQGFRYINPVPLRLEPVPRD